MLNLDSEQFIDKKKKNMQKTTQTLKRKFMKID